MKPRLTKQQLFEKYSKINDSVDAKDIEINPLTLLMKKQYTENVAGIGDTQDSLNAYLANIDRLSKEVSGNPSILDKYHMSLDTHMRSIVDIMRLKKRFRMEWRDKYLYWRANPWIAAWDLIGDEALNRTTAADAPKFMGFTPNQRRFLRDFCDPRFTEMCTRRCRGGSKTFDIAVAISIMEFFTPKLRITINSGSEKQSRNLYTYFTIFINYSVLSRIVVGKPLKSETQFVHGGWVQALTASPKQSKGVRPDVIIFDEVCEISEQLIVDALGGTWTATNLKIVFAGTPDKMGHKFYRIQRNVKLVEDDGFDKGRTKSSAGYYIYHWDATECPWIPPDNIEKAKKTLSKSDYTIQIDGNFASGTGSVFDHDCITLCTYDDPDLPKFLSPLDLLHFTETAFGVDWGFAHPTVVTIGAVDEDDILHVIYNYGKSGLTKEWTAPADEDGIIPRLYLKYDPYIINCDSEAAGENRDLSNNTDGSVKRIAFNKYKGKMVSELRKRFEHGKIRIYSGLHQSNLLLEQLYAYEYQRDGSGEVSEKPIKTNDDFVDSLMLCCYAFREGASYPDSDTMNELPGLTEVFAGGGTGYWE